MLLAFAVAIGSVAIGAALGALPAGGAGRAVGPIQVFALSAALAVVGVHLLPEAYTEAGPLTVAVFLLAFGLPALVDWAGERRRLRTHGTNTELGLEIGYVGLLVHKVGDGLALGAATGSILAMTNPTGVILAIGGHTVPLTALIVLAFQAHRTTAHALLRAAGLAAAMCAGVLITAAAPATLVEPWQPWITAAIAGLLLHVVIHGFRPERPRSVLGWVGHGAAVAAGLAIVLLGGH
ncbi:MAG: hypothetical protein ACOCV4_03065 [Myxococcota bacterium]